MSMTSIWVTVGIIVIVIVAGVVLLRPASDQDIVPTNTPGLELNDTGATLPGVGDINIIGEPTTSPIASPTAGASDSNHTGAATESPAVTGVKVSVDDNGFTPAAVTVPAGTTVTFVNDGQGAHWPASAVHPTHQLLPDFNARKGLATGETYSYTFTKVGTWTFHDHLNPTKTGQMVVQ